MTSRIDAKRLRAAYETAWMRKDVARYFDQFRRGDPVAFRFDPVAFRFDPTPISSYAEVVQIEPIDHGVYQLRYYAKHAPLPAEEYAVWGRLSSSKDGSDWVVVHGPWRCGEGPFDRKGR